MSCERRKAMNKRKNMFLKGRSSPVVFLFFLIIVSLSLSACKDEAEVVSNRSKSKVGGQDPCSLITQQEIDSLFSGSVGAGRSDSQVPNVQTCTWPQEGVPKFLLQVMKAPQTPVSQSINAGEGYHVREVSDVGDEAAVAIQQANPRYGLQEGVAILGFRKGSLMVTLSPVHLDIQEGTQKFEELKALAAKIAERVKE
jgi:hypothetical protein